MNSSARRSVFVTGGSRGIGSAIVKRMARDGANVAFTYAHNTAEAERTAGEAREFGAVVKAIAADSADAASLTSAVDAAGASFGGLHVLVNNAGIATMGPVDSFKLADFDRIFAINVRAAFVATQAALKHMKQGARIINIGSCNAERMPFQGGAAYAMSKAALVGLVKGLARDLGPRGISINNIQPGPVATEMNPENGPFADMLKKLMAIERYSKPEEIAAMVAYLAGPEAEFITGASLTIDGGFSA